MIPEPTHAHAFPATHPRRVPGEPRRLRVADLYTRADAITDHLLIEVPLGLVELYRLPWPLAVTSTAWADAIAWPPAAHAARPGPAHRSGTKASRAAWPMCCSWSRPPTRAPSPARPSTRSPCGVSRPPPRLTASGRCASP